MIDKIIKKRLDVYYSNTLINEITDSLKCVWCLDFKTKKEDNRYVLCVKKTKYKDSEYKVVLHFRRDEAIIHLVRLDKIK